MAVSGVMCNVMTGTVGYHAGQYEDYVLLLSESVQFGYQVQTFRRNVILPWRWKILCYSECQYVLNKPHDATPHQTNFSVM